MVVAVAAAAAMGSVCRWLVDAAVRRRVGDRTPLGILAVNLTGSLALGLVAGLGLYHGTGEALRTVVGTGFVGAYTTFSAFAFETVLLAEAGEWRAAVANVALSVGGGLVAATAGLALAAAL